MGNPYPTTKRNSQSSGPSENIVTIRHLYEGVACAGFSLSTLKMFDVVAVHTITNWTTTHAYIQPGTEPDNENIPLARAMKGAIKPRNMLPRWTRSGCLHLSHALPL